MDAKASRLTIYCSFCCKADYEVAQLIAGPTAFICNECVGLCSEVIAQGLGENTVIEAIPDEPHAVMAPGQSLITRFRSDPVTDWDALAKAIDEMVAWRETLAANDMGHAVERIGVLHGKTGAAVLADFMFSLGDTSLTFGDGTWLPCDFIAQHCWELIGDIPLPLPPSGEK